MEGTDEMIRRAGALLSGARRGGEDDAPRQDMRFVSTVGTGTLRAMAAAGLTCLAVEAGRTISWTALNSLRAEACHRRGGIIP